MNGWRPSEQLLEAEETRTVTATASAFTRPALVQKRRPETSEENIISSRLIRRTVPVLNSNFNSSLFHKHLSTSAGSCVHFMLLEQDTHYLFITRLLGHHPKEEKNGFLSPPLVCSHSDHKLKESDLSLYVKSATQAASPVNALQILPDCGTVPWY